MAKGTFQILICSGCCDGELTVDHPGGPNVITMGLLRGMKEDQRKRLCGAESRDEVMLLKMEQVISLGIWAVTRS